MESHDIKFISLRELRPRFALKKTDKVIFESVSFLSALWTKCQTAKLKHNIYIARKVYTVIIKYQPNEKWYFIPLRLTI